IFGSDPHQLAELGKQAAAKLDGIPDLVDVFNGVEGEVPSLEEQVDPVAAARVGTTPQQLAGELEVLLAGRVAARVRVEDRTIGVRVRLPDEQRFDPAKISDVPLALAGGQVVRLGALATPARPLGPATLLRENQRPMILMTGSLRGGGSGADLGGVTA